MFITAEIIGVEYHEIQSGEKLYHQTILYIRDVDRMLCVYEGLILGEVPLRFKLNDVIAFRVLGIHANKRQICLVLEICDSDSGAGDGGRAFTRKPPFSEPRGATPSNTAPPKYIEGVKNGL